MLVILLALMLPACVASRRGLVHVEGDEVLFEEYGGRSVPVRPEGEGRRLAHMDGCEVRLEAWGRRRLQVRSWQVLAGPDGGLPFIGRLRLADGAWVLDDRNTGGVVTLRFDDVAPPAGHVGEEVVVTGYIVGPQQVQVVWWRALGPRGAPGGDPGDLAGASASPDG